MTSCSIHVMTSHPPLPPRCVVSQRNRLYQECVASGHCFRRAAACVGGAGGAVHHKASLQYPSSSMAFFHDACRTRRAWPLRISAPPSGSKALSLSVVVFLSHIGTFQPRINSTSLTYHKVGDSHSHSVINSNIGPVVTWTLPQTSKIPSSLHFFSGSFAISLLSTNYLAHGVRGFTNNVPTGADLPPAQVSLSTPFRRPYAHRLLVVQLIDALSTSVMEQPAEPKDINTPMVARHITRLYHSAAPSHC